MFIALMFSLCWESGLVAWGRTYKINLLTLFISLKAILKVGVG